MLQGLQNGQQILANVKQDVPTSKNTYMFGMFVYKHIHTCEYIKIYVYRYIGLFLSGKNY